MHMLRCAAFVAAFLLPAGAEAHGWYSDKKDPEMGSCCDGNDCGKWIILPGQITAETEGYRVRLTREQVLQANPESDILYIDQIIPWHRVQPSEDGDWHVCPKYAGAPDDAIRCLFEPPNV